MKSLKLFLIIGIFVQLTHSSLAQDIHFTQFYMHPLTVNPALAGDYSGGMRASFINRRQWGQLGIPIETIGASVEHKVWLNGDYLILGGLFLNDKANQIGFITNKGYLSTTYQKTISRHVLNVGVQAGFSATGLDPNQTFPSQFNGTTGTFDFGLDNNEPTNGYNRGYLDVNIGIFWKTIYRERFRFKTGASVAHINRPNESFSSAKSIVPFRYLIHHSTEIILNRNWSVSSQSQAMYTGQAKEFITSINGKRDLTEAISLSAGLGYRGYVVSSDAVIAILGIQYHYIDIGLSYDWNVSELSNNSNQKTSIELSFAVRTPAPKKRKPVLFKKNKPCPIYVDPT